MCIYVYWSLKEKNLYLLTLRLNRALESPSEELSLVLQALVLTLSCTLIHAQGCGQVSGIQELWNVNLESWPRQVLLGGMTEASRAEAVLASTSLNDGLQAENCSQPFRSCFWSQRQRWNWNSVVWS